MLLIMTQRERVRENGRFMNVSLIAFFSLNGRHILKSFKCRDKNI